VGDEWDRRQNAEDRWRRELQVHRDDPRAHSAQRHQFINDTIAPWQARYEERLVSIENQQASDAKERSELKGMLTVLRWELRAAAFVLATFGGFIAVKVWG
jgi:hypothetical protein